jgi:hypothetical protein
MCIWTDVPKPPAEGKFYGEVGRTQKPVTVEDHIWHMGYVYKWDRMTMKVVK